MAFKIQNLSFWLLTKYVRVYLSAETGQFWQLIWFARMNLAAENVSMSNLKFRASKHNPMSSYMVTSYTSPWRPLSAV